MAGGILYSIQLQLRVDDSQLDAAIAKLNTLKRSAKDTYVRVGAGGGNTPRSPRGSGGGRDVPRWTMSDRLRDLTNWRFSRAGWQSGLDVFNKRVKTFQDSFFNNLSSLSGLRYNAVNLGKVFTSLGGAVGKAIPAIGALTQGAMMAGKIWVGVHGWRLASSGVPLYVGTKILNSNNLSEAGSNLMQMRMAEKGLGGNYQSTLNRATQLAAEYGFSRVGMLNAMNMFTGLNVDGKKLTAEDASYFAEVVGKIAHVGGLSFDRVNRNIQQLFAMAKSSSRDLNELTTQAPYIGKLATNMMAERGVTGDYREWLKNKSNLRSVLDEFNKLVESHPVMKARGEIALAKENFWITIADRLSPYWDKIAKANEKLYSWLGDRIVSWVRNIDPDTLGVKLNSFTEELNDFTTTLGKIAATMGGIVDVVKEVLNNLPPFTIGKGGRLLPEMPNFIPTNRPGVYTTSSTQTHTSTDPQKEVEELYEKTRWNWKLDRLDSIRVRKRLAATFTGLPADSLSNKTNALIENITRGRDSLLTRMPTDSVVVKNWFPADGGSNKIPRNIGWELNFKEIFDNLDKLLRPWLSIEDFARRSVDEGQQQLADLSKGSKSIFINFNREIVKMDVNIASVGDIDELGRKLEPKIEEVVVRGLTIALNNATSAT